MISMTKNQESNDKILHRESREELLDTVHYWRKIDFFEKRYKLTGNPLFVFSAIQQSRLHNLAKKLEEKRPLAEAIKKAEKLLNSAATSEQIEQISREISQYAPQTDHETIQIPAWCVEYLSNAASELTALSYGLDRKAAPPLPDSSMSDSEQNSARDKYFDWVYNPTITAQEALDRVPAALGFRRQGWNAMAERRRDSQNNGLAFEHHRLRRSGLSSTEAFAYLADHFGVDDRTIRRRIQKVNTGPKDPAFQRILDKSMAGSQSSSNRKPAKTDKTSG